MSFSDNLKTIRKEKNLSQEELAELLGVSRQAVSKWELGDGYPEVEKLLMIAGKLNVSMAYLLDLKVEVGYEDFIALKEKEGFRELISTLKEMDSEKIKKLAEMAKII